MTVTRIEDYPAQQTMSPNAEAYHKEVLRLWAEAKPSEEARYGADAYQSIAVFAPARPNGVAFAFLHGGGWTNGYKEWMSFMAPAYTAHGFVFATIGYRLAPAHVFPAGLDDCAAALKWLVANMGKHGAKTRRVFLGGHSAGGHYAAWLAVRKDWQARHDLPDDVIRGCLPISGVYRFGEGSGMSVRPRFLGPPGTERQASPIENIQNWHSPFFIAHGDNDFPHLVKQAEEMEAALKRRGASVQRLVLADRDHFTASYAGGEPDGPYAPQAIVWMKSIAG